MKYYLLLLLLGFSSLLCAQNKIAFTYDNAGNQTKRELCLNCIAKDPDVAPKEAVALTEEDLLKFSPEDTFSYYPNPVREELFLSWQLTNEKTLNFIQVFDLSGKLLTSFTNTKTVNEQTIQFQSYPKGIYAVVLFYSDGEQKSIKIIKQ